MMWCVGGMGGAGYLQSTTTQCERRLKEKQAKNPNLPMYETSVEDVVTIISDKLQSLHKELNQKELKLLQK